MDQGSVLVARRGDFGLQPSIHNLSCRALWSSPEMSRRPKTSADPRSHTASATGTFWSLYPISEVVLVIQHLNLCCPMLWSQILALHTNWLQVVSTNNKDQGSVVVLCRRTTHSSFVVSASSLATCTIAVKIPQLQHLIPDPLRWSKTATR